MSYFHSVTLDREKCHGCTNCIKRCPTEAIRVRGGKAKIIKERCIDCGECIRVCPYHAKLAVTDPLEMLEEYEYNIALPAPSLYGQFKHNANINKVLTGLLKIGFDHVFEVARGAEYVSAATRELMEQGNLQLPVISSACPAVVRLIRVRFPDLLGNVIQLLSPMEVAAKQAREAAQLRTGLEADKIGVFFITPCPAKVTSIKAPLAIEKSYVSGALSVNDIYVKLLPVIKNMQKPETLSCSGFEGISWARSGGESEGTKSLKYIAVDGINHVMKILEEIEDDKLENIEFIELSACTGGCVGGALNVENSFVSSTRIKNMAVDKPESTPVAKINIPEISWKRRVEAAQVMKLDDDFNEAIRKMEEMERIYQSMPDLDCGSCGAPSCRALAEDIVRGFGNENDCIFKMRERVRELAKELFDLEAHPYGSYGNENDR